jgi:hypothetical protein
LRKGALTVRRFIGKVSLKWNPFQPVPGLQL